MAVRSRKALKIVCIFLGSGFLLLGVLTLVNLTVTAREKSRDHPPGMMVEIDSKKMHIWSVGTGATNVVLLTGLGTLSPVADFRPLTDALKTGFRVTVVERFGYGWSDWTNSPRTNRNIVEETRLALREAGVYPPYVLVPHSISGLYALYYADRYPDEVRAVIGLDITVPQQASDLRSTRLSGFLQFRLAEVLRVTGILRLALAVSPSLLGYQLPGYSHSDRRTLARMGLRNLLNKTQLDESTQAPDNAKQLEHVRFPEAIPISIVLSRQSIESIPKEIPGLDWVNVHQDIISGNKNGRLIILDGSHYIHQNNPDKIAAIVQETIGLEPAE